MSNETEILREQCHIKVIYFTKSPPDIVWYASSTTQKLTSEEFREAAVFAGEYGEELIFKSKITDEEIVKAVKQSGGLGPILVSSIHDYTFNPQKNEEG